MSKRTYVSYKLKKKVLERDNFKCQKCDYSSDFEDLEIHHIISKVENGKDKLNNLITLCSICHYFAPDSDEDFKIYLNEKIDGKILETFRKSQKSIAKITKKGMDKKARDGGVVVRPALGYKFENKQLVPDKEKSLIVPEIFHDFLNIDQSLTKLAKKYSLSVGGLKKVLRNFTYLGKTKFAGQILDGKHQPIISPDLFNKVQKKLEDLGIS